jgi:hypothetical protein
MDVFGLNAQGNELNKGQERCRGLVVAHGNTPELLQL